MKLMQVLPLAAFSVAFVIPDEQIMSQVAIESDRSKGSILQKSPSKDHDLHQAHRHFQECL